MRILFKVQSLFLLLILFHSYTIHAQGSAPGKTTLVDGHHIVGVKNLNSTIPLKYSFESNFSFRNVPGYDRPYQEGGSTMNNFMSDAALAIDWWTLFGEPAEQYGFVWKARNYYEIIVPASTGGGSTEVKTVSKSNLSKYPDLLMRYEALKPTEVALEIEWGFGVTDGDIFDQTGYSFISYYGTQNKFKTAISSANILTEPSGKSPFAVPGIRPGKGEAFLGLPNDFPKDKVKLLMQLFATTKYFYITQVNITKIKWPITEMRNIAELYEKYEKGELDPAPLQIINEELKKAQNLSAYKSNDFWSEAFEEDKVNISLEVIGSDIVIKNKNRPTFKTDRSKNYIEMFSTKQDYRNSNTNSKYLIMWNSNYDEFRQGYKNHISGYPHYLIDYTGKKISIDSKTKFKYINSSPNQDGLYEFLYYTDEWTYVRDICYTAGSGGIKLGKIAVSDSYEEAKAKLINYKEDASSCEKFGVKWSKYGVAKFIIYYLNDKMQIVKTKTEYHNIQSFNY